MRSCTKYTPERTTQQILRPSTANLERHTVQCLSRLALGPVAPFGELNCSAHTCFSDAGHQWNQMSTTWKLMWCWSSPILKKKRAKVTFDIGLMLVITDIEIKVSKSDIWHWSHSAHLSFFGGGRGMSKGPPFSMSTFECIICFCSNNGYLQLQLHKVWYKRARASVDILFFGAATWRQWV
jgi:hypothetical protein